MSSMVNTTMEKRMELEMKGHKPSEVTRLTLDKCRTFKMEGLKNDFVSLESLSLIDTNLTSLDGFPGLPALKSLELGDNKIERGFENLLGCPKLTKLHLGGNKVADFKDLEPLKKLGNLKSLDLFGCPISDMEDYRDQVFVMLPQLQSLDGFNKDYTAVVESEDDETNDEEDLDGENDLEISDDVPSDEEEDDVEDEEEEDLDDDIEDEEDEEEEEDEHEVRGMKRKLDEEDEK